MVNAFKITLLSWLVLAVYAAGGLIALSALSRGEDASQIKARVALSMELNRAKSVVAEKADKSASKIEAKKELQKAMGKACDCESCDCNPCKCESKSKTKSLPPVAPAPRVVEKVQTMKFSDLRKMVEGFKAGESVTVYAGQSAPPSASGKVVVLIDLIPDEAQIVGVWKCYRTDAGDLCYESLQPKSGGTRLVMGGRFYDKYADGSMYWCVACNGGAK